MKKKNKFGKKIVFTLDIEPYSQNLIVVCNGQFSDAIKVFKKYGKSKAAQETLKHIEDNKEDYKDDYKVGGGGACLYTELPNGFVMLISHLDSWIKTTGLVVHESLHLTHYVLRRAGVILTKESEESFTYLTEETVEKILSRIY